MKKDKKETVKDNGFGCGSGISDIKLFICSFWNHFRIGRAYRKFP